MPLHVVGDLCPACKKRGLVVGGFNPLDQEALFFRPMGWLIDRLEVQQACCPQCGFIVFAIAPKSLERLRKVLRKERESETVTYHAKTRRRKKEGGEPKSRPANGS
ncbi:MAG: hypothetical protein M5U26_21545 [Planctomycetota bacterium]|nr:hypothetical protein [Planctomycetota bacterium]